MSLVIAKVSVTSLLGCLLLWMKGYSLLNLTWDLFQALAVPVSFLCPASSGAVLITAWGQVCSWLLKLSAFHFGLEFLVTTELMLSGKRA